MISTLNSWCQIDEFFPAIDKTSMPDAKFQKPEIFTGATLSEYMNGGAMLFQEYGCTDAWVNEIAYMKGKFKVGIFRMYSPEEAFGIFSVEKETCEGRPPLTDFTCQTKYHLQISRGRYYISIINETGNQTDSVASIKIGEAIVSKIGEPSADLSSYLPGYTSETIRQNAILVKGKLGLMNGAPDSEEYLKDAVYETIVIIPDIDKTVVSIKFRVGEELMKFASQKNWKTESVSQSGNKMVSGENVSILSETHILIEIPR